MRNLLQKSSEIQKLVNNRRIFEMWVQIRFSEAYFGGCVEGFFTKLGHRIEYSLFIGRTNFYQNIMESN